VNAEYQTKLEELSRAKDDMQNLLNSTEIATLFLDRDLNIQSFTAQAQDVISVIPSDIGRPVADFASHLRYDRLTDDARRVLETLVPHEIEVQTREGKWRLVRILPYLTSQNVIDGVVVTIVDVDRLKRAELLAASRAFAQSIVQTVREPLVVIDSSLRVVCANRAFIGLFELDEGLTGSSLLEIGGDFFTQPRLRALLAEVTAKGRPFQDFAVEHAFHGVKHRILLNARRLESETVTSGHILLALTEVTEH
jgi:two-component system CheB/CheR fusion protein